MPPPETRRITFNLLESEYEELEAFAREKGITKTDALRRALNLAATLYEATDEKGETLLTRSEDGELQRILLP